MIQPARLTSKAAACGAAPALSSRPMTAVQRLPRQPILTLASLRHGRRRLAGGVAAPARDFSGHTIGFERETIGRRMRCNRGGEQNARLTRLQSDGDEQRAAFLGAKADRYGSTASRPGCRRHSPLLVERLSQAAPYRERARCRIRSDALIRSRG